MLFGNENVGEGIGYGDIKAISRVGNKQIQLALKNVLHVLAVGGELLSVTAATDQGCSSVMGRNKAPRGYQIWKFIQNISARNQNK